ncbi:MAG TPA: glycosyl transferase, partial [Verrucomicrobiota bacterium]|nr:glycosyl transferase [Verrucomicrobiota bacterium]
MILDVVFGTCAGLSIVLLCWQWLAGRRFALHRRHTDLSFVPAVSLLKPLKGSDAATEQCLRSWLAQDYAGPVQILFGVASADDPAVEVVERVLRDRPSANARLVVCGELAGTNAKASKLARLE